MKSYENAYFSDVLAVAHECTQCTRNTCPQWCKDFTREQRRELDDKLTAARKGAIDYSQPIYIRG